MPIGCFVRTVKHRRNISQALRGKKKGPMPLEIRRKISKTLKGRPHTKEHNRNVSKALTGRKRKPFSEEWKKNLSLGNKGKWERGCFDNRGEGWKRKISETRKRESVAKGKRNPNWKGGLTALNVKIRNSDEYKEWRKKVFERDNYACTICRVEGYGKNLEADHIKPLSVILEENGIKTVEQALKCEELWDVSNGRTLCKRCHEGTDTYGWRAWNKFLKGL